MLRSRRFWVITSVLMLTFVLLGSALTAEARCLGCVDSNAYVESCNIVFESVFPYPYDGYDETNASPLTNIRYAKRGGAPSVTVWVKLYDNGVLIAEQEVTGVMYESYTVYFPITQLFAGENVSIIVANNSGDPNDYIYWGYSLLGEGDVIDVPDSAAAPCIAAQSQNLQCPYPPTPMLGQGRVINATPTTYYAPNASALTNPQVVLAVGTSWWILEGRDGFYKLFIACQGQYIWVSAEALGANFDVVWNGAPLPNAGTSP